MVADPARSLSEGPDVNKGDVGGTEPMDLSDEDRSREDELKPPPQKFRRVENVKSDFTENSDQYLSVYLYVKGIERDTLTVEFESQSFSVTFQTTDPKFLSSQDHGPEVEGIRFIWDVSLRDRVNPLLCRHRLTANSLELKLSKRVPRRWGGFLPQAETPKSPSVNFIDLKPPAVHWFNASSGGDNADAFIPAADSPRKDDKVSDSTPRKSSGKDANCNGENEDDSNNNDGGSDEASDDDEEEDDGSEDLNNSSDDDDAADADEGGFPPRRSRQPESPSPPPPPRSFSSSSSSVAVASAAVVPPGMTGLDNIGNTCFMNSIIQCLANTRGLRDYFLRNEFARDLNRDNPLGMQGKLATAFGQLLHAMWLCRDVSVAPTRIKNILAHKASQFLGFAQHDAHEFMAFLLDGLHEDLNRIRDKPYTPTVESNGRPDVEVAEEAWRLYKRRNNSVIVDLFQGQYRSKLICPVCGKVSITFDPFLYLSVPLPKRKRTFDAVFFPANGASVPFKYSVKIPADAAICDLVLATAKLLNVPKKRLRVALVNGTFFEEFPGFRVSLAQALHRYSQCELHVYEVFADEPDDPLLEFRVTQRLGSPPEVRACSSCKREPLANRGQQLLRCNGCFRVAYCDQQCQMDHWPEHQRRCRLSADLAGHPFLVSLNRSRATFSRLVHALESCARYSVDVFQPPIGDAAGDLVPRGVADPPSPNDDDELCPSTPCTSAKEEAGAVSLLSPRSSMFRDPQTLDQGPANPEITLQGLSSASSRAVLRRSRLLDDAVTVPKEAAANCDAVEVDAGADAAGETDVRSTADTGVSMATDDASVNSDSSSVAELHVKRKYPAFDVFLLPRHQSVNTHARELVKLDDEGGKLLDFRSRCVDLVMDWRTNVREKGYVVVEDKPLTVSRLPFVYDGAAARPANGAAQRTDDESLLRGGDYSASSGVDVSSRSSASPLGDRSVSDSFVKLRRSTNSTFGVSGDDSDDLDNASVDDCLRLFVEPEKLSPEEAWYCSNCKRHREATKEMSLWRLPNILILQLKRFSFKSLLWRDKIDRMIWFPVNGLDLSPYWAGGGAEPMEEPIYDLYGVVNHFGSMIGGHYTSFVRLCDTGDSRKSEVGWRLCDDAHVAYVDEAAVVSRSAYVLFYKRRQGGSSAAAAPNAATPSLYGPVDSVRVPDSSPDASIADLSVALHLRQQQQQQLGRERDGGKEKAEFVDEPPTVTDL